MLDAFENEGRFSTHLAVENERSPVELVARLTCTSLQILATWPIKSHSCTFKDFVTRHSHSVALLENKKCWLVEMLLIADVKQSNASKCSPRE